MDERPTHERHVPVLLGRCLELLAPALDAPGAVAVDATLGLAGHAEALLRAHPGLRLVGLDRDPQALGLARARLAPAADRVDLVHAVYDELPDVLDDLGLGREGSVAGVLFDLGVSSLQLDEGGRGFAYAHDAPLDMRMDQSRGRTAAEVVNTYPPGELVRVLRTYGEERFAQRIVGAIVREREREPFTTSARLAELVRSSIPAATRRTGGHPAKRTFQALRIEVNAELEVLERAVPAAVDALAVGGRVVVMSYHSLEDRVAKRVLTADAASTAPPGLPVELPEHRPLLRPLTRGAEAATEEEVAANPRAASVRLRAAERLRPGASRAHRAQGAAAPRRPTRTSTTGRGR
ncbi:16S rRNA (cytosine(1402)-N(4))-methyltransferase RsmH [Vallicoccus soli]|uniref:Ribosomal RNA small subunit methyltransferase H n=1 Tax=Vallicoccus soli TaxID=2339232 RepID=A0A3A3Z395_9ACTN|nr:16S rRNA (cytosine(1402)-N(4))-methyltransferase RsmH [Vallicoccus soli]RJK97189.1 16S rRNA (cytosine(1402)-N(4))-methyltransferase RsmH [Vallicoccus soli]